MIFHFSWEDMNVKLKVDGKLSLHYNQIEIEPYHHINLSSLENIVESMCFVILYS